MVDKIPENNLNRVDFTKKKLDTPQTDSTPTVPMVGETKPDLDKGVVVEKQKQDVKNEAKPSGNKTIAKQLGSLAGLVGGGAAVGAVAGSIIPGAGTVAGAIVGGAGALIMGLMTGCIKDELKDMPPDYSPPVPGASPQTGGFPTDVQPPMPDVPKEE